MAKLIKTLIYFKSTGWFYNIFLYSNKIYKLLGTYYLFIFLTTRKFYDNHQ